MELDSCFQLLRQMNSLESENSLQLQSAQFLPNHQEDKCIILRGQEACWKSGNLIATMKYVELICNPVPGAPPLRMPYPEGSGPRDTGEENISRHCCLGDKKTGKARGTVMHDRDSCWRLHLISRRPVAQKHIMGPILSSATLSAGICEIAGS